MSVLIGLFCFARRMHVIAALTRGPSLCVIPAKAGIHKPVDRANSPGIPAFAVSDGKWFQRGVRKTN
jgi:hypothetical protein